jgi:hypothetical protein
MAKVNWPPKTIEEIMDDIERIREELLMVQNALQKMEGVRPATFLPNIPK